MSTEAMRVQRWTGQVTASDAGGFVSYGDYLELKRNQEALDAAAEVRDTAARAACRVEAFTEGSNFAHVRRMQRQCGTWATARWLAKRGYPISVALRILCNTSERRKPTPVLSIVLDILAWQHYINISKQGETPR
jgi:hypothetical protein